MSSQMRDDIRPASFDPETATVQQIECYLEQYWLDKLGAKLEFDGCEPLPHGPGRIADDWRKEVYGLALSNRSCSTIRGCLLEAIESAKSAGITIPVQYQGLSKDPNSSYLQKLEEGYRQFRRIKQECPDLDPLQVLSKEPYHEAILRRHYGLAAQIFWSARLKKAEWMERIVKRYKLEQKLF